MPALHIEGGFAGPVLDAQAAFRAVMDAMARPGTIVPLAACATPPSPLSPTAGAIALTLADHDAPVWLDPALGASDAVAGWLGFHTGAPIVPTPSGALFALVADPAALPELEDFAQGTHDYPDRSATLILQVDSLETGAGLVLEGPGIEHASRLAPSALPRDFTGQWRRNNARFPRGVDLVLAAPGAIAGLPRTTRIRTEEG